MGFWDSFSFGGGGGGGSDDGGSSSSSDSDDDGSSTTSSRSARRSFREDDFGSSDSGSSSSSSSSNGSSDEDGGGGFFGGIGDAVTDAADDLSQDLADTFDGGGSDSGDSGASSGGSDSRSDTGGRGPDRDTSKDSGDSSPSGGGGIGGAIGGAIDAGVDAATDFAEDVEESTTIDEQIGDVGRAAGEAFDNITKGGGSQPSPEPEPKPEPSPPSHAPTGPRPDRGGSPSPPSAPSGPDRDTDGQDRSGGGTRETEPPADEHPASKDARDAKGAVESDIQNSNLLGGPGPNVEPPGSGTQGDSGKDKGGKDDWERTEVVLDYSGGGMATPKFVTPEEKKRIEEERRKEQEKQDKVQPGPGAIMLNEDGPTRVYGPGADYETYEEVTGTSQFEEEQGIEATEGSGPEYKTEFDGEDFVGTKREIAAEIERRWLEKNPQFTRQDVRVVETDKGFKTELTQSGARRVISDTKSQADERYGWADFTISPTDEGVSVGLNTRGESTAAEIARVEAAEAIEEDLAFGQEDLPPGLRVPGQSMGPGIDVDLGPSDVRRTDQGWQLTNPALIDVYAAQYQAQGYDITSSDLNVVGGGQQRDVVFTDDFLQERRQSAREQQEQAKEELYRRIDEQMEQMVGGSKADRMGVYNPALRQAIIDETELEPGVDYTRDVDSDGDVTANLTESKRREIATQSIQRSLEDRYGVQMEPGKDFKVKKTDEGYRGKITDDGRVKIAAEPETGETWLDENVINPTIDTIQQSVPEPIRADEEPFAPGPGDLVQQVKADLREDATIHQIGEGWIPNAEEMEELVEGYRRPPMSVAPSEEAMAGFAYRAGQTVNPAALTLGVGNLVEGVGEYGYNVAVGSPTLGRPEDSLEPRVEVAGQDLEEATEVARQRSKAQEAAAGAAVTKLLADTEKGFSEQPGRTSGAALFEIGTLMAGEALSPIRLGRARFATVADDATEAGTTTYRGLTLGPPRALRGVIDVEPKPVIGAVDRSPAWGTPDVGDLASGYVPRTPLETRIFRETAAGDLEGATELLQAEQQIAQLADMASGRRQTVRSAEEAIGQAKRIPPGAEAEIVDYLRREGHVLKGSAGQATAVGRTRRPVDVDLKVGDPEDVARDLAEIVQKYTNRNVRVRGGSVEIELEGGYSHLFDIKATDEAPAGSYFRYGRRVQDPSRTAEGVLVQPIGEQLQRKATASMMAQGEGVRATRLGPESHRVKDVFDTSLIARNLIGQERGRLWTRANPIRRRRLTRAEEAVETFEEQFSDELAEAEARFADELRGEIATPSAGFATGLAGVVDTDALARRLFGQADRGQVTPADILPGRFFRRTDVEPQDVNRILEDIEADAAARRTELEASGRSYYDEAVGGRDPGLPLSSGGAGRLESGDMTSDLEVSREPTGSGFGGSVVDLGRGYYAGFGNYEQFIGGGPSGSQFTGLPSGGIVDAPYDVPEYDIPSYSIPVYGMGGGGGYDLPTYDLPTYPGTTAGGGGSGGGYQYGTDIGFPGSQTGRRPEDEDEDYRRREPLFLDFYDQRWVNPVASASETLRRLSEGRSPGVGEEEMLAPVDEDIKNLERR